MDGIGCVGELAPLPEPRNPRPIAANNYHSGIPKEHCDAWIGGMEELLRRKMNDDLAFEAYKLGIKLKGG